MAHSENDREAVLLDLEQFIESFELVYSLTGTEANANSPSTRYSAIRDALAKQEIDAPEAARSMDRVTEDVHRMLGDGAKVGSKWLQEKEGTSERRR